MNMHTKKVGYWTLYTWKYANRTVLQEMATHWVHHNADQYGQFELPKMWADFQEFQKEQVAIGAKDTVTTVHRRGATIGSSGEADHYSLILRDKRSGVSFLCISEPVGTEALRAESSIENQ